MSLEKEYVLNDGDILKVEGYTLLISTLTVPTSEPALPQTEPPLFTETLDLKFAHDDIDFLEPAIAGATLLKSEDNSQQADTSSSATMQTGFSPQHRILSDDPFASDPFADLDSSTLEPHRETEHQQLF